MDSFAFENPGDICVDSSRKVPTWNSQRTQER